ncbi:MAG: ribosome small subunit-dependent GTPase A [Marinilabiliales bacterium]|nr:MAG: ribosome small subunit-dependent GTPase A [Marinilabiliales bacterium]
MKGKVIKSTGRWYMVQSGEEVFRCSLRGNFRLKGIRTTNPIAVGDNVEFTLEDGDETGLIQKVEERKNVIIRKATNLSKATHLLAANLDLALVVVTPVFPRTSTGFIDRFLITAEAYHIPALIVINKIDILYGELEEYVQYYEEMYRFAGYDVRKVSALEGNGIDDLRAELKDKVTLFTGHSGVGKSALINALDSEHKLKTGDISHYHLKGKHTTTFAEMHPFSFGGYLIDTPGIKEFGVVDFEAWELGHWFPDFKEFIPNCKFKNCTHVGEPDCAVRAAAEEGRIHPERYHNYLSILRNVEDEESDFKTS